MAQKISDLSSGAPAVLTDNTVIQRSTSNYKLLLSDILALVNNYAVYTASGALTLTTGYQDVSGVTTGSFTPTVNEYALVWLSASFNQANGTAACNAADVLNCQLDWYYSSADHGQTPVAQQVATGNVGLLSVTKIYLLSLTASTAYTLKAQAQNATGARGTCNAATQMLVLRLAR